MTTAKAARTKGLEDRRRAPLATPTDPAPDATRDITDCMNAILADAFALDLETKNFPWHLGGPHFRDSHLPFDEQAAQLLAMTDPIAGRVCSAGGTAITSIGHNARPGAASRDEERP